MKVTTRTSILVFIAVCFAFLFNYPIINIPDQQSQGTNVATLIQYLFGLWVLLIIILYIISPKKLDEE